jgi:very-short-patch-repair endonuclease
MYHKQVKRARGLRRASTEAEKLLWQKLRARQLGGAKFRRQTPIGPYIVDFVSFEHRLVVEIDGGQHNMPQGRQHDLKRTAWLEAQGFRVLRFWNNQVLTNLEGVLERTLQELEG